MKVTRRSLLPAAAAVAFQTRKPHVAVVGAGAFGGWTALHLLRLGARVTLVDAWGPGNSRASSGGETRIIRAVYADRIYVQMTVRALQLWRDNEARWNQRLYRRTGFLRMVTKDDSILRKAAPLMREAGVAFEELTPAEARKRYPQINFEGVSGILLEKEAGFLTARRNCEAVVTAFRQEGGEYREIEARPGPIQAKEMRGLALGDGSRLAADRYVFACGPWMGKLFPEVIGARISPHRKEVYFFGVPAGEARFSEDRFPAWGDLEQHYYGVPGNERRGFKVGEDAQDVPFDPTSGDRTPSPGRLEAARAYLGFRFPALRGAPLVEARVCQYENTPDRHLIIDRHPLADNVWLAGGGSGHGYKMGPAVGERMAELVLGKRSPDAFLSLSRFSK
ncbi:MAG: FAD-dependent oxidoreductase [Acidobacteria bacterium]|nr:FAD-dependent oxidoreductase [Acidobacteriota bacterium]